MPFTNAFLERFGLSIPIIQAPMLGATDSRIVSAVSSTGAMGTLAAGALAPAGITEEIARLKKQGKPFGANLLVVPKADPDSETVEQAVHRLAKWRKEFGLPEEFRPNRWSEDFRSQLDALIEAAPPTVSFTFDLISREDIAAFRKRGTYVMGTATDVREARAWAEAGADATAAGASAGADAAGSCAQAPGANTAAARASVARSFFIMIERISVGFLL